MIRRGCASHLHHHSHPPAPSPFAVNAAAVHSRSPLGFFFSSSRTVSTLSSIRLSDSIQLSSIHSRWRGRSRRAVLCYGSGDYRSTSCIPTASAFRKEVLSYPSFYETSNKRFNSRKVSLKQPYRTIKAPLTLAAVDLTPAESVNMEEKMMCCAGSFSWCTLTTSSPFCPSLYVMEELLLWSPAGTLSRKFVACTARPMYGGRSFVSFKLSETRLHILA